MIGNQKTDECTEVCNTKKSDKSKASVIFTFILLSIAFGLLLSNVNPYEKYVSISLLLITTVWFFHLKKIEFKCIQKNSSIKCSAIGLIYTHFMTDFIILLPAISILITKTNSSLLVASLIINLYLILTFFIDCTLYKVRDKIKDADVLRVDQELDKEIALLLTLILTYLFIAPGDLEKCVLNISNIDINNIFIVLFITSILMSSFSLIKTWLTRASKKNQNKTNNKNKEDDPVDNGTLGIDLTYYASDTQADRYQELENHDNKSVQLIALCYKAKYQIKDSSILNKYLKTLKLIKESEFFKSKKNINTLARDVIDNVKKVKNDPLQCSIDGLITDIKIRSVERAMHGLENKIKKTQSKIEKHYLNSTRGFLRILAIIFYLIGLAATLTLFTDIEVFNQDNITFGSVGLGGLYYLTKDFTTSIFAGLRIYVDDLFRVGDRIRINDLELTGVVIGFNPSTVSIKSDDNSITRIYMSKIIASTFKNLSRREDKGRLVTHRIKIDVNTIKIINNEEQIKAFGLDKCFLLKSFFADKLSIINNSNNQDETEVVTGATKSMQNWLRKIKHTEEYKDKNEEFINDLKEPLNSRFITNIGAYREYLIRYLNEHNLLDNEQYTMVRYRDVSSEGVTIEVRAYTERQYSDLYTYEIITSDILEVMLAILPEFRLGLFQAESSTGNEISFNKN